MPIITLEGPKLTVEQKRAVVKGFTEVISNVLPHIRKEGFIVQIRENIPENVGVGGALLSDIHAGKDN